MNYYPNILFYILLKFNKIIYIYSSLYLIVNTYNFSNKLLSFKPIELRLLF